MTTRAIHRILIGLILLGAGLAPGGCVERTITITSEPVGALVHLNDEEVGRTPLTVPFTHYGVYDVRLEHEGYNPLWTTQEAKPPVWDMMGPDLLAEMVPNNKAPQNWHFRLEPTGEQNVDRLIGNARQLRSLSNQPQP